MNPASTDATTLPVARSASRTIAVMASAPTCVSRSAAGALSASRVPLIAREAVLGALASLAEHTGRSLIQGPALGLVLVADDGDSDAILALASEFQNVVSTARKASPALFDAFAHVPTGRLLKAAADFVRARGPTVLLREASDGDARALADDWLGAGRAQQVVVVVVGLEGAPDRDVRRATARAVLYAAEGGARCSAEAAPAAIAGAGSCRPDAGASNDLELIERLAASSITVALASAGKPAPAKRGIVLASFLGNRAASLKARARGEPCAAFPALGAILARLPEVRFDGPRYFVHGTPGASLVALGIAADALRLGRADQMVVCGVDRIDEVVEESLFMVRCPDRPHFRSGAAALVLERARERPACRRLDPIVLFTPMVRRHSAVSLDMGSDEEVLATCAPQRAVLSGCTEFDLHTASAIAAGLPRAAAPLGAPEVRSERYLAPDTLFSIIDSLEDRSSVAVVAANALGGTGVVVSRPSSP